MTKTEELLAEIRDTLRNLPIKGTPEGDDRRGDFFPTNRQSNQSYLLVQTIKSAPKVIPGGTDEIIPEKNIFPKESDGIFITILPFTTAGTWGEIWIQQKYRSEEWQLLDMFQHADADSYPLVRKFYPLKNVTRVRIDNDGVIITNDITALVSWWKIDIQGTG